MLWEVEELYWKVLGGNGFGRECSVMEDWIEL